MLEVLTFKGFPGPFPSRGRFVTEIQPLSGILNTVGKKHPGGACEAGPQNALPFNYCKTLTLEGWGYTSVRSLPQTRNVAPHTLGRTPVTRPRGECRRSWTSVCVALEEPKSLRPVAFTNSYGGSVCKTG